MVKKGLTLIELLVVIFILGLLAAATISSFSASQQRSRDLRRKEDLDAIKKALELAKQDTQGATFYPSCGAVTNCSAGATTPALAPTYIQAVPTDPKSGNAYTYTPTPVSCTSTSCRNYTLTACLENGQDPDRDTATDTTNCPTSPASYAVKSN